MNFGFTHHHGPYTLSALAQAPFSVTAAGTNDATEKNGQAIDRLLAGRRLYLSAKLVIAYTATLDTAETIAIAANAQTDSASAFNVAAADLVAKRAYKVQDDGTLTELTLTSGALASTVIATGGTETGVVVLEFDLHDCEQYLRSQFTVDLSRAGTDTAVASATWEFAGADQLPAT